MVYDPTEQRRHRVGVRFGGWSWRYDLDALSDGTTDVTLTYDWSGATPEVRGVLDFPPFAPEHLDNSLAHLAELAADRTS